MNLHEAISNDKKLIFIKDVIELDSPLIIKNKTNIKVIGPGTIKGNVVYVENCKNVVFHHVRFRLGNEAGPVDCATMVNCIDSGFERCSFAYSVDELVSLINCKNCWISESILAFPLHNSVHPKGSHGLGPILSGQDISFRDNFCGFCSFRPVVHGTAKIYGNTFFSYDKSFPVIVASDSFANVVGNTFCNTNNRAMHVKTNGVLREAHNRWLVQDSMVSPNEGSTVLSDKKSYTGGWGVEPYDKVDILAMKSFEENTPMFINKPFLGE